MPNQFRLTAPLPVPFDSSSGCWSISTFACIAPCQRHLGISRRLANGTRPASPSPASVLTVLPLPGEPSHGHLSRQPVQRALQAHRLAECRTQVGRTLPGASCHPCKNRRAILEQVWGRHRMRHTPASRDGSAHVSQTDGIKIFVVGVKCRNRDYGSRTAKPRERSRFQPAYKFVRL